MPFKSIIVNILILLPLWSGAQSLSGYVMDQDNNPIPFVNVYFKGTQQAAITDEYGYYYHAFREIGFYEVVYSAIGYQNVDIEVTINDGEDLKKNIYLTRNIKEIQEAVIKAKRRDPAYEIIANAIEAKDRWLKQYESSQSHVYIKAKEVIDEKEKKKRKKLAEREEKQKEAAVEETEEDIFEKERKEKEAEINKITSGMNMVEIDMERSYQFPNKVKEIRNGFKKLGSTYGLYFINTAEADFNFYDNLMNLENLNELPLVSPLHITSILTYKFSLIETTYDEKGNQIFKIEVTPRKRGNASWTGHIWIQNEEFCIRQVDLSLEKGGLYVYDSFRIQQSYDFTKDSLVLLTEQEFDYISKSGLNKFTGNTYVKYTDYELNITFPKNYFRNEVAVTTQEAYDKDSTYWHNSRPKPLTLEEQRFQFVKDSVETVRTSKEYLDSLDRVTNKVTFLDVAWFGIDKVNRAEKRFWYINPLAAVFNPLSIGGARLGAGGSYFRRYPNQKYFAGSTYLHYGLRNEDIKGNFALTYFHDPMHQGKITLIGANRFNVVAANDAITNLLQRSNWIQEITGQAIYSRELFNGFYIQPSLVVLERRSIASLQFNSDADDLVEDNEPYSFETYQATVVDLELTYTPFQKYMTEPYRKVILGSKWPTFYGGLQVGLPNVFGSDVQYTRVTAGIRQNFKLGTMGTSSYKLQGGKYLDTRGLKYEDTKIFPRADRWFFASLMESMQLQDTTLVATDVYLQAHYTHHFNGAIVNYIPFVKKLGIQFSGGVSALYIKDNNYRYAEAFVGIERSFKIQRHRYRVGVFYVAGEANQGDVQSRFKIAISQFNIRDKSWGY